MHTGLRAPAGRVAVEGGPPPLHGHARTLMDAVAISRGDRSTWTLQHW